MVTSVLCTSHFSRIQSWLHWKNGQPKKSCSRLADRSCTTLPVGFVWAMFSVETSRTTARSRETLIRLSWSVVITPHHRCLVANMAWDPVASHSLMPTIWGFWVAVKTALASISHVSLQVYKKTGLGVHDISLAGRIARIRSVAQTVSSRRRICGRAMELVNGHKSFLALSNRGALSILDANFKFARASFLVSREPWSTVRLEQ